MPRSAEVKNFFFQGPTGAHFGCSSLFTSSVGGEGPEGGGRSIPTRNPPPP